MLKLRLLLIFLVPLLASWPAFAGEGCDCASLESFCGDKGADFIRHISRRRPSCSTVEIESCGMKYRLSMKTSLPKAQNQQTDLFMKTIENEADTIMELYRGRITPREYTELAAMAFGIVGNESNFFYGKWYLFKKALPAAAVEEIKCRTRGLCGTDLSFGPTQMKSIPKLIADKYGVSLSTLYSRPDHAAVATMGFLIEKKEYMFSLKKSFHTLAGLDESTYPDYLAYFYQGKSARPLRMEMPNPADRSRNGYLYSLREYKDTLKIIEYSCPARAAQSSSESETSR